MRAPLVAVVLAAVAACAAPDREAGRPAVSESEGLAAFETVRAVLQHPRCQNCHVPGDAPLQFDEGRRHGQDVVRGPEGEGAPGFSCGTCHGKVNPPESYGPHVPPGAPEWRLPPPQTKMVFIGLGPRVLALRLKDRRQTRGKDLEAMYEHIAHDELVGWGWNPGAGRTPVPVPRDQFAAAFRRWIDAGAPVPAK